MYQQGRPSPLATEAYARIQWGSPPDEIREWLYTEGLPTAEADAIVDGAVADRDIEFRKRGIREIIISLPILVLPIGAIALMWADRWNAGRGYALCGLIAFYGFWRFVRGLGWLFWGAGSRGSLAPH